MFHYYIKYTAAGYSQSSVTLHWDTPDCLYIDIGDKHQVT